MLRRSNFFVRSVRRNHPHSWACTNQTARERSPSPYARDQARDHRLSLRLGLEICIHQSDHDSFGGIFELTVRQRQPDLIKPADLGPDMLWLALDLKSSDNVLDRHDSRTRKVRSSAASHHRRWNTGSGAFACTSHIDRNFRRWSCRSSILTYTKTVSDLPPRFFYLLAAAKLFSHM